MAKKSNSKSALALDVGSARIGIAAASLKARLPRPVTIVPNDKDVYKVIKNLADREGAELIIVGLPRNMSGQETKQSDEIRKFTLKLQDNTGLLTTFADESLSSLRANESAHGYRTTSKTQHLDDVAACFILEEFFQENEGS